MFKNLIKRFVKQEQGCRSYSQSGEDLIVKYLFDWLKFNKFSYLDIGAFHPWKINNTYLFYLMGFTGVNIDGNYNSIASFNKFRPKDRNINALISSKSEQITYYQFDSSTLNTIDEFFAKSLVEEGKHKLIKESKLEAIGINDVLYNYFSKDTNFTFFSLDVEGFDFKILKEFDFSTFSPKIICVETVDFNETSIGNKNLEIIKLLEAIDYIHYADTYINSIFVKRNLF
jgi:hypothetical protein